MKHGTALMRAAVLAGFVLIAGLQGGEGNRDAQRYITTDALIEAGQIVKGESQAGEILQHLWMCRYGGWVIAQTTVMARLELKTSLGVFGWAPTPNNLYQSRKPHVSPNLAEARATFSLGNLENPWLKATVGYFPFKYNPDSRNLGEYMYRATAYPPVVTNTDWIVVNRSQANLLGFRLNSSLGPFLDERIGPVVQDLLFTSETQNTPLWDWSLGYLFSVGVLKGFDIGAGVNFWRQFPADTAVTTPRLASNMYIDTASNDTSYYSYKSIKTTARASLDIKKLIPMPVMRGHDLKLYGELAVLDWKGQDTLYRGSALRTRIPIMAGINVPTHPFISYGAMTALEGLALLPMDDNVFRDKLNIPTSWVSLIVFPCLGAATWAAEKFLNVNARLDLLSWEVEWYNSPYQNSMFRSITELQPQPSEGGSRDDNLKWSIYAEKEVIPGLNLRLQFARDHHRAIDFNNDRQLSYKENITKKDHWYWMLQINYGF